MQSGNLDARLNRARLAAINGIALGVSARARGRKSAAKDSVWIRNFLGEKEIVPAIEISIGSLLIYCRLEDTVLITRGTFFGSVEWRS